MMYADETKKIKTGGKMFVFKDEWVSPGRAVIAKAGWQLLERNDGYFAVCDLLGRHYIAIGPKLMETMKDILVASKGSLI